MKPTRLTIVPAAAASITAHALQPAPAAVTAAAAGALSSGAKA